MLVLSKEVFTEKIDIGDLVQDSVTGEYALVGFKQWEGKTQTGYFLFEFADNDISGIYDSIEELVDERELRLIAKNEYLVIEH